MISPHCPVLSEQSILGCVTLVHMLCSSTACVSASCAKSRDTSGQVWPAGHSLTLLCFEIVVVPLGEQRHWLIPVGFYEAPFPTGREGTIRVSIGRV